MNAFLRNIKFNKVDKFSITVLFIYILLTIINFNRIDLPLSLIGYNIGIIIFIFVAAYTDSQIDNKLIFYIHKLYPLFFILFIYGQVQEFISILNPVLYDEYLIEIDRFLFGTDPTVFLSDYSHPLLTEYLQITYFSFYLLPVIHGAELLIKKDVQKFDNFASIVLFTFYLSYLLYLYFPAVGPRFFLHDFGLLNQELPGVFLTEYLREMINAGGGIPENAINPLLYVYRDCMPSGHTMITLITISMVFINKSKFRYIILIIGISLIFATVYLRYHYVIDLLVGLALSLPIIIFRNVFFEYKN
jgi:membrane-associated phospholipid phosphatase